MNKIIVTPTCKYGHGEMQKDPNGSFAYVKVEEMERSPIPGSGQEKYFVRRLDNTTFFRVNIWRCSTCGYIETFDAY